MRVLFPIGVVPKKSQGTTEVISIFAFFHLTFSSRQVHIIETNSMSAPNLQINVINLYLKLQFYALAISECKSELDVLKRDTPYLPNTSTNALFDNPTISAA